MAEVLFKHLVDGRGGCRADLLKIDRAGSGRFRELESPRAEPAVVRDERGRLSAGQVVPSLQIRVERFPRCAGQVLASNPRDGHRHGAFGHEEKQPRHKPAESPRQATTQFGRLTRPGIGERASPQPPGADQDHLGLRRAGENFRGGTGRSDDLDAMMLGPPGRINNETLSPGQAGHDGVDHRHGALLGLLAEPGQLRYFERVDQPHDGVQKRHPVVGFRRHRPQQLAETDVAEDQHGVDITRVVRHDQDGPAKVLDLVESFDDHPITEVYDRSRNPPNERLDQPLHEIVLNGYSHLN